MAEAGDDFQDIFGIQVPLITPFRDDESLDEPAMRLQVRYMIGQGVHGVVVGGSTGEGYALSQDELCRLVDLVAEELAGRLPLIGGVIVDSTREAIARGKALAGRGVRALQVTPPHYIFPTGEDAMVAHFRAIAEATGIPVMIYNVIPWNYLSIPLLLRILDEVPGVIGVKQSSGDLRLLSELVAAAPPRARIFGAIDALIYPCLAVGAHGVISQILAALPGVCVRMWNLVQAADHASALDLHRRMGRVWSAIAGDNRVAVSKYTLSLQGVAVGRTRRPLAPPTQAQMAAVRAAIGLVLPELAAGR
jgi:4-hydroxy-tetrahydrodipicolinate synthase